MLYPTPQIQEEYILMSSSWNNHPYRVAHQQALLLSPLLETLLARKSNTAKLTPSKNT